jgi:tight adherence protein B
VFRDVRWKQTSHAGGGQASAGVSPFDTPVRALKTSSHRLDQRFAALIESCGTHLDVVTAMAVVMAGVVLGGVASFVATESVVYTSGGMVGGGLVPVLWWSIQRVRRMVRMEKQLPHALEVVADCVRNGHSLEGAAGVVAAEGLSPLSDEFAAAASRLKLGHNPTDVLDAMSRRIPLPEFHVFATAAAVHQQTGGNLAVLTERLAAAAIDRRDAKEHLAAVTSGSRLSAVALVGSTIVGVTILSLIRPEYLQTLWNHPLGTTLLGTASVLLLVGVLWTWRVLRIRY